MCIDITHFKAGIKKISGTAIHTPVSHDVGPEVRGCLTFFIGDFFRFIRSFPKDKLRVVGVNLRRSCYDVLVRVSEGGLVLAVRFHNEIIYSVVVAHVVERLDFVLEFRQEECLHPD